MTRLFDSHLQDPENEGDEDGIELPVEVEFYIQPDGSVVFADLAADVIPIARELNPDVDNVAGTLPPQDHQTTEPSDRSTSNSSGTEEETVEQ